MAATMATPICAERELAEAHALIFEQEHFFWNNKPQCRHRDILGGDFGGIGGTVTICELVEGHAGPHEVIRTRTATAEDVVKILGK